MTLQSWVFRAFPFVHYEIRIAMVHIEPLKFYCVRPGVPKIEAGSSGGGSWWGRFSPKYQNADGPLVARTEYRLGRGPPELQKDFHLDKFPKVLCSPDETQDTKNYALFIPLNMNKTKITWNFNASIITRTFIANKILSD